MFRRSNCGAANEPIEHPPRLIFILHPTPQKPKLDVPVATMVAGGLLVLAIVATAIRIAVDYGPPGPFDPERQGMVDFHNGIYFPARAMMDGVSPYGATYEATYPVSKSIPLYSPSILVLHLPLALLPLRAAEIASVVLSYAMILAIGWFLSRALADHRSDRTDSNRQINQGRETAAATKRPRRRRQWHRDSTIMLCVAALIACSRGGHVTAFNGYFTFQLILATLAAIHYAPRRPWLAALALVIVAVKPTYILPLGFLLFARGNWRALGYGAVLSVVATFVPLAYLAYCLGEGQIIGGFEILFNDIVYSQAAHRAVPWESPTMSWTRIDLLALVAKWSGGDPANSIYLLSMVVLNLPAMWILHQRRKRQIDDGLLGFTGFLVIASMLISVYHQFYDALLWVAPLVGIATLAKWHQMSRPRRWLLATILLVPLFNIFSTDFFLSYLASQTPAIQILTSINAVAMVIAWVAAMVVASREIPIVGMRRDGIVAESLS